jgi:hypothetical protein
MLARIMLSRATQNKPSETTNAPITTATPIGVVSKGSRSFRLIAIRDLVERFTLPVFYGNKSGHVNNASFKLTHYRKLAQITVVPLGLWMRIAGPGVCTPGF